MVLALNQSLISAVFAIVRFLFALKPVLSGDSLYMGATKVQWTPEVYRPEAMRARL